MFEVPAAKRIKRSELFNDTDSAERQPSPNPADEINEKDDLPSNIPNYGFEYDLIEQPSKTSHSQPSQIDFQPSNEDTGDVFAFNLFRPSTKPSEETTSTNSTEPASIIHAKPASNIQKSSQPNLISIRSPSPDTTAVLGSLAGKFTRPRPDSTYFTSSLPDSLQQERKERYASSAISASALLALAKMPWPGTALPWKVLSLPVHKRQVVVHEGQLQVQTNAKSNVGGSEGTLRTNQDTAGNVMDGIQKSSRRPRPSKKRRELIAARSRHRQMLIDETKTKEEHEREKKNQKNRERKLKRRAKERREKTEKAKVTELAGQSISE